MRINPSVGRVAALVVAAALLGLQGCSDDSGGGGGGAEDALAEAKQQLDDSPAVDLELTTDPEKFPEGIEGILEAVGTGTHAPAFEGDLKVKVNNLTADVPVISVDGAVWAKLPFSTQFVEVDPAAYAAPDPAELMAPEGGISAWLTAVEDVEAGDDVREGDQVLTTYSGTLPGKAVAAVLPSASAQGEFDAEFRLDDEDRLVAAVISGPFYGQDGEVTYDLSVSGYGSSKDTTAPSGQ
jgi:lipoprotein LprG